MMDFMNSGPAIEIQGLTKYYGTFRALDNLSLEVQPGEFVAFLGPNGAGKTTTIHSLTGLCNFQQGQVKVFGHDVIKEYRQARPLLGLCPQEINLDPFLTIEQTLIYQAGYFGVPKAEASERANELLIRFRLDDKRKQDFRKLSGGMKRRLLLCRALVHDPQILILDEPTAGTDLILRHLIWDYLKELNAGGKTIFLTTHYMEEAERLAKSVIIVDKGRIIHRGETASLVKNETLEKVFLRLTKDNADD